MFSENEYIDCSYSEITTYYIEKLERRIKKKLPELNMTLAEWVARASKFGYYVGTYRAIRNTISEDVHTNIKQFCSARILLFTLRCKLAKIQPKKAELKIEQLSSARILRYDISRRHKQLQQLREAEHEVEQLSSVRILRSAFGCMQTRIQQRKKAEEEIRAVAEELVNKAFEQVDEKYKAEKDFNNNEEAEMELIEPVEHVAEAAAPDALERLWKEKLSVNQCICRLVSEGSNGRRYLETIAEDPSYNCDKCIEILNYLVKDDELDSLNPKYENYEELKIAAEKMYEEKLTEEPIQPVEPVVMNDMYEVVNDKYRDMYKRIWNEPLSESQCLFNIFARSEIGRRYIDTLFSEMSLDNVNSHELASTLNQDLSPDDYHNIDPECFSYEDLSKKAKEMYECIEYPKTASYLYAPINYNDDNDVVIKVLFNTKNFREFLYANERDFTEVADANKIYRSLIEPFINRELFNEWTTPNTVEEFRGKLNRGIGTRGDEKLKEIEELIKAHENTWDDKPKPKPKDPMLVRKNQNEVKVDLNRFIGDYNDNRTPQSEVAYKPRIPVASVYNSRVAYNSGRRGDNDMYKNLAINAVRRSDLQTRGSYNKKKIQLKTIELSENHKIVVNINEAKKTIMVLTQGEKFSASQRDFIINVFAKKLFDKTLSTNMCNCIKEKDVGTINSYASGNKLLEATLNELDNDSIDEAIKYIEENFKQ